MVVAHEFFDALPFHLLEVCLVVLLLTLFLLAIVPSADPKAGARSSLTSLPPIPVNSGRTSLLSVSPCLPDLPPPRLFIRHCHPVFLSCQAALE
jgi:hypothetical protein